LFLFISKRATKENEQEKKKNQEKGIELSILRRNGPARSLRLLFFPREIFVEFRQRADNIVATLFHVILAFTLISARCTLEGLQLLALLSGNYQREKKKERKKN
jgi:hypothetical protein